MREREKTFNRNLASVKKEFADVTVENASLRWSRGNVDDNVAELVADVGLVPKVVAESAQLEKTQVAQSVDDS